MSKKTFPTLYAKASTGKVKVWRIWAEDGKPCPTIVTEYGWKGSDNLQRTVVKVPKGKNVGRSNETTPFEQACLEAEAKWTKKQDKKYTPDPSGKSNTLLPMLAHDYKKRKHHVEWPAYVQPKLNGVRCLATKVNESTVKYTSRGGKDFATLEHLTPALLKRMKVGETLDGELFTEELTFQEIVSAVKRKQDMTGLIQYWIYDVVMPGPFTARAKRLDKVFAQSHGVVGPLRLVPSTLLPDEDKMMRYQSQVVQAGFEGTIIRNSKGEYRKDFRSPDLQKHKDFLDEEFKIVGAKEGIGRAEGTVTWTCVTEDGKEFDVRPRGTHEQRTLWWKNHERYIGKQLTVRYQNRSDDNIPIFPVGLAIRDYE